jgi:hypothetical protein
MNVIRANYLNPNIPDNFWFGAIKVLDFFYVKEFYTVQSFHTVICPSIFEGENFGEIFGGLFFKDFLNFS